MKKIFLCLAALTATAISLAAETLPAEKLLPADTLGVFSVPDYAKARDIYMRSPQGQLWRDPAMKAFVEKFTDKLTKEFIGPLEKDLGVSLTNYLALLQGQVTLACVQNGWSGGSTADAPQPGWLLLLDTKDKSAQLKTNLTELKRKWTDAGKASRTEKIRDVEFTVLKLSTNDVPPTMQKLLPDSFTDAAPDAESADAKKPAATLDLFIGQSDSLFIAGNQAKAIEMVLTAQAGGSAPTLGEQPVFAANQLALFRDAPFYGWINTKIIVEVVNKMLTKKAGEEADRPSFTPFRPDKIIGALGLDALKAIAFSARFTDEGGVGEVLLTAPESERRGLLSLIAAETKETLPPAFVPADAIKFQRLRLNSQKTWENLEKALGNLSPQLLSGLNFAIDMAGGLAKEKNPDYDLKKSLLTSLGDDVISYEKAPRSSALVDMAAPPSLTLVGAIKPEQFIEAVQYLITGTSQRGKSPKEREFRGRKIYTLELPPLRTASGKTGPERSLSFAAANGYVAFSADTALLEEFLRSDETPGKPLRATPGLTDAVQKVTSGRTSWLTYENQVESMRAAIAAMKQDLDTSKAKEKDKDTDADDGFGKNSRQKFFTDWLDLSLLPEFDKIAKYFSFTVGAGNATPEGLGFKVFAPVPPQLKAGDDAKK